MPATMNEAFDDIDDTDTYYKPENPSAPRLQIALSRSRENVYDELTEEPAYQKLNADATPDYLQVQANKTPDYLQVKADDAPDYLQVQPDETPDYLQMKADETHDYLQMQTDEGHPPSTSI